VATKRLIILTTGGTIAGRVSGEEEENLDQPLQDAYDPQRDFFEGLESTFSQIHRDWNVRIEISVENLFDVDSTNVVPSHWVQIIDAIHVNYDMCDGFIILHGTNTMGYTAAALSFALGNLGKPVIVTGSQVPFGWSGSDAKLNIENSLRVAARPHEGGIRGVVCVFGSHIIIGTRAKKDTEFDYDAFKSFNTASLGRIGRIIDINHDNLQRHHAYLSAIHPEAKTSADLRVERRFNPNLLSFTEFPGMKPEIFMALLRTLVEDSPERQLRGVVFRAFGAGDVSMNLHKCFEYLKDKRIPVIVTTQAPNGNSTFDVNQPGMELKKRDLAIPAFDMSIESITTKLMWLLGQGIPYEEIKAKMHEDLHGEIRGPRSEKKLLAETRMQECGKSS
jgi:L-asparaginase